MGLHKGFRLLAFVVPSRDQTVQKFIDHKNLPSLVEQQQQQEETDGTDGDLRGLILNQLSLLLPSYSVPDTLLLVPALSHTPHGEYQTHSHTAGDVHFLTG